MDKLFKDLETVKYSFKNKLAGKRKHPRFIVIRRLAVQIEVIQALQTIVSIFPFDSYSPSVIIKH